MFNVQTQFDKIKNNNNTYGPVFVNEDAMKRLAINYWDKNMVIQITDMNKDKDGYLKSNDSSETKLIITRTTISSLLSISEDVYDLIKSGKEFSSSAVPCGIQTSNLVEISNGKNIDMPDGLYLVIYKDINEDRTSKGFTVYPFSSKVIVREYNHKTGQAKTEITKLQEFKDFITTLREFHESMSMAVAHAVKEGNKYEKLSTYKTLSVIAAKMGIDLMSDLNSKKRGSRNALFEDYSGGNNDNRVLTLDETDFSTVDVDEYLN